MSSDLPVPPGPVRNTFFPSVNKFIPRVWSSEKTVTGGRVADGRLADGRADASDAIESIVYEVWSLSVSFNFKFNIKFWDGCTMDIKVIFNVVLRIGVFYFILKKYTIHMRNLTQDSNKVHIT